MRAEDVCGRARMHVGELTVQKNTRSHQLPSKNVFDENIPDMFVLT